MAVKNHQHGHVSRNYSHKKSLITVDTIVAYEQIKYEKLWLPDLLKYYDKAFP
jgi:hypothetical protein